MTSVNPTINLDHLIPGKKQAHDGLRYCGYLFLLASLILYAIEESLGRSFTTNGDFAVFFAHYIIALAYTLILWYNGALGLARSWRKEHIHRTVVLLNLFLVSAYALNREIAVFNQSTAWLCVYIFSTSVTMLSFAWYDHLPRQVKVLQLTMLGTSLLFYIYLAVNCVIYYGFGFIGLIAIGIGGHIFVPMFLVIASISLIIQLSTQKGFSYTWILAGAFITISFVTSFVVVWNSRIKAIEKMDTSSVLHKDAELPLWVRVASSLPDDWITQRILKSNLTYRASDGGGWSFTPERRSWSEQPLHDPLIIIASQFRVLSLSREDRIKILESVMEGRHEAQDRLWSGNNLVTSDIVVDADIFANLKLAYTEMYLSVRNDNRHAWALPQEAIYTFQLPEGSVITSLSLWINGKEEKAILTSKQKASKAYETVVGVEVRDPSVVHWQEGNTVTVRVFPCTTDEKRKFKIGITSPLSEENGRVYFKSINFKGPSPFGATQLTRLRIIGDPSEVQMSRDFDLDENGEYIRDDKYDPSSTLSFKTIPLGKNQFTFNGFSYSMSPLKPTLESRPVSTLYLDINKTWSRDELDSMHRLLSDYKIFVNVDDAFVEMNEANWHELVSKHLTRNFSIFPFYKISDTKTSLVISKGKELSPFLADFKDSEFARQTASYFASKVRVSVFNLSTSTSTYIRSLRELRAIDYASGSASDLLQLLKTKTFPVYDESSDQIVLHDAGICITRQPASGTFRDNAPDHLARLFAYNNIMRQVGVNFFSGDFIDEALVQEATSAYVVSPVSSLIVLETKEDYDSFGIEDSNNSLHNASKASAGAVPEPHEWALIIVFGMLVIFCINKQWHGRRAIQK
ncbi:XrtN system VIT domain-containing protein [Chryseolinea sp. T2]|uniref:XrtN system VIT domain-containing protein n=1 Tax=Chryseolinea sp. T2 TaxID=3129255 RepID=UPI003077CC4C